ncbi:MAG: c-type cytochrome [Gammaproteobacteria bacterium]
MLSHLRCLLLTALILGALPVNGQPTTSGHDDPAPTLENGVAVFGERCVICHGPQGLGEGLLPLRLKDYPSTSLKRQSDQSIDALRDAVVYGGSRDTLSDLMPPMGDELTWTEIESVVMFVQLLRQDAKTANAMLMREAARATPTARHGMQVFQGRCVLCHGAYGEGDGRMARIIKDPPPANLTSSTLSDPELLAIISAGGEAVGRSPQMPPWSDQLSLPDIQSLILYINSIR